MAQKPNSSQDESDNYFQISDDEIDDCDGDDSLLEEADAPPTSNSGRGPYERAWTTEATRALIHIRGPMEGRFTEGRQKRTALWLHCTRQLQKLGYRYSAAKVQKKWHNILITYNKNLSKKYMVGYVHWEFFEEMFKYLQGKKADCEPMGQYQQSQSHPPAPPSLQQQQQRHPHQAHDPDDQSFYNQDQSLLQPQVQIDVKSNDDFDEERVSMAELKKPKYEYNASLPLEISHASSYDQNGGPSNRNRSGPEAPTSMDHDFLDVRGVDSHTDWWKDYFERKLQMDREKMQLQKDMHRELMQYNKMSMMQQEKLERTKIDAINNLTSTLQKLMDTKNRRTQ